MDKEDYLVIQKWMLKELNLKGHELTIFAIVYSFSRDGESEYYGSSKYLSEWTGATKKTVLSALKSLVEKELLTKHEEIKSNIKFCTYRCNFDKVDEIRRNYTSGVKITLGGEDFTLGRSKNYSGGGVKITPNNIYNNKEDKKENNKGVPTKEEKFKEDIQKAYEELELDHEWQEIFNTWFEYKIERKEYLTPIGIRTCIKKNMKDSNFSTYRVQTGVENSMANNYQGLFLPKEDNKPKMGIDGIPIRQLRPTDGLF